MWITIEPCGFYERVLLTSGEGVLDRQKASRGGTGQAKVLRTCYYFLFSFLEGTAVNQSGIQ